MKLALQIFIFHIIRLYLLPRTRNAQMAKLVDALCSGRSVRKDVLVRIQFWALQKEFCNIAELFLFTYPSTSMRYALFKVLLISIFLLK